MNKKVELNIDGKVLELPTITGSEGEEGMDISALRSKTGFITLDPGYGKFPGSPQTGDARGWD